MHCYSQNQEYNSKIKKQHNLLFEKQMQGNFFTNTKLI